MKIVADADLPFLDEMFAGKADVVRLKGPGITAAAVKDADAVVVRSVTPVGAPLLSGSRVRFAGTASIGTDHVDAAWLAANGIAFASAPGCNAGAVSEYVVAALLELSGRLGSRLRGASIGVVGAGNVGSRVAAKASALGMEVILNDPPLGRSTGSARYRALDDLMDCDVVTIHVPLNSGGPDPTWRLFNAARIGAMRRGSILINSARGAVVDPSALAGALRSRYLAAAAMDVWEGEPSVDLELLSLAAIGTPHVAGYSNDAKARASEMIYEAICLHFGWKKEWRLDERLPPPDPSLIIPGSGGDADPEETIRAVVRLAYPILRDDAALRQAAALPASERPGHFIRLRNEYPLRREFPAIAVRRGASPAFPERELSGLGFRIVD